MKMLSENSNQGNGPNPDLTSCMMVHLNGAAEPSGIGFSTNCSFGDSSDPQPPSLSNDIAETPFVFLHDCVSKGSCRTL